MNGALPQKMEILPVATDEEVALSIARQRKR
jgi:hypothetical protein